MNLQTSISSSSFPVGIPFLASEILSKNKDAFFLKQSDFTEYQLNDAATFTRVPASRYDSVKSATPSKPSVITRDIKVKLSPELTDRLMGKCPLRLVAHRSRANAGNSFYWNETLECGHSYVSYPSLLSDIEPTAKRRRCQECKGEQALRYTPYVPAPILKDSLTARVIDYLNWAQANEDHIHLRDDIAIARLAVILAGQGDPEPWRWAFIQLLGGSPEKLIPIFVSRMQADLKMELPPKKRSASEVLPSSLKSKEAK